MILQRLPPIDVKQTRAAARRAHDDCLFQLLVGNVWELLLVVLVDPLLLDLVDLVLRHKVYRAASPAL